jgi:long-chain fatty acid transport protein
MIPIKTGMISVSVIVALSSNVFATEVFNLEGFGPISRGLGGTGVAHDIGPAAMMYNPATLGLMAKGSEAYVGLDAIVTDISTKNKTTGESIDSSSKGNNRDPYFAPQAAYTHSNEKMTYGVGVFAQGGLGTEFGTNSFLSKTTVNSVDTGLDNNSRLLNLRIPFAGSYKVNDKLTIGGSLDAVWSSLNLGLLLDVSQVGALAADGRVTGNLVPTLLGVPDLSGAHFGFVRDQIVGGGVDAWGLGAKVGLTYQATPRTRIGAAYNAETKVSDLKGKATLTAVSSTAGNIPLNGDLVLRDFQNPAQLSLGVSHQVNSKWTVLGDYQRVYWENAMKDLNVGFVDRASGQNIDIKLPLNYKDINIIKVGAEYKHNGKWTFRGGYSHSDQAVPGSTTYAVVPAYLTDHLTVGASYALSKTSKLDFALSHAFEEKVSNSSQPSTSIPIESSHSQNNIVVGYSYKF